MKRKQSDCEERYRVSNTDGGWLIARQHSLQMKSYFLGVFLACHRTVECGAYDILLYDTSFELRYADAIRIRPSPSINYLNRPPPPNKIKNSNSLPTSCSKLFLQFYATQHSLLAPIVNFYHNLGSERSIRSPG